MSIVDVVDLDRYPLDDGEFQRKCRSRLDARGCLELRGFIRPQAVQSICAEGDAKESLAYFCAQEHNVYLTPPDDRYDMHHVRNRNVTSSKGCITDDQISPDSALRTLYESVQFRQFLCAVLNETELHQYADTLSSINLHYASNGQELGWHFDNSSFAITIMIRKPDSGGRFEYILGVRDADNGDMNFDRVGEILEGEEDATAIDLQAGTLLLFRGRDAIHRVTPVTGEVTRMLAVLAYNAEAGVALSESARMTFYGRLK